MSNSPSVDHPPPDVLLQFALGKLARQEAEPVEEHLEHCPSCCEKMADREAEADPLIGWLKQAGQPIRPPTEVATLSGVEPAAETMPGLLGRYEILGELGRGSMGVVYKARDTQLRRLVAIKVMRQGAGVDADALARFHAEGLAVARLRHPHIVQLLEVGEEKGTPYQVLEYLDGGTLACVCGGRSQPFDYAARVVQALAEGVEHAHAQGVIHRDLKPANVLLTADGVAKVTDFGLVKFERRGAAQSLPLAESTPGLIIGTPHYMAPEQTRAVPGTIGPATDVYALGAILYELLTGNPPFAHQLTLLELLQSRQNEEPPSPRSRRTDLPRDLEVICLKCLRLEPQYRYATAGELAAELGRFLRGEPIAARPVGAVERLWRGCRRNPLAVALALVTGVALLALGGLGVGYHFNARLQDSLEETQEANQRAELYLSHRRVSLAHAGWREGDLSQMETLLDACPTGHRNWEWYYLKRLCHTDLLTLRGHTDEVVSVAFSPDGRRVSSGSRDRTVKVWDLETGRVVLDLTGHSDGVLRVAFSPDGKRLASGSLDRTVKVWDASTGELLLDLTGHTHWVRAVAFSPDGSYLASASLDQTIRLWDATTGRCLGSCTGHTGGIEDLTYSPDGTWLASVSADRTLRLWKASTRQELAAPLRHPTPVRAVACSPDGSRLASASMDGLIRLWDVKTGQIVHTIPCHTTWAEQMAFSPDGSQLALVGREQSVMIWNATTGQMIYNLRGHTNWVYGVAFSPDSRRLASAGMDHMVKIWDLTRDQEALTLTGHADGVGSVAFQPRGTLLASASNDHTIRLWDAASGQLVSTLRGHQGAVWDLAFSPDGTRLASVSMDGTTKVWDATRDGTRNEHPLLDLASHPQGGRGVAFSLDSKWIASGGRDNLVKIWDAQSGQLMQTLTGHSGQVEDVAFSPDSRRLASVSFDQTVRVWEVETGRQVFSLGSHTASIRGVVFSPREDLLISCGYGGAIKVWSSGTGAELYSLDGHAGAVFGLAISPDGTRLATAGADGRVRLWDLRTRQETLTLRGHTSEVFGVAFSWDGTRLASASRDGTAKIWNGQPLPR